MAGGSRSFDPESAQAFTDLLTSQVDLIDTQIIEGYFKGNGVLTRMPAFGVGENAEELGGKYREFHGGVWDDLHVVRADLLGYITVLQDMIENHVESDSASAQELQAANPES
ncbi:hypothetical protein [Glycomyces tenuis]|uniref:hypothetical protein n=1 Tax=Glycomyces tenuis TaxID=58116 RepID=UPI000479F788|nr:hypothetical protein [Glycomyces tenuis]